LLEARDDGGELSVTFRRDDEAIVVRLDPFVGNRADSPLGRVRPGSPSSECPFDFARPLERMGHELAKIWVGARHGAATLAHRRTVSELSADYEIDGAGFGR
jgi:hypothetical protein